MKSAKVEHSDGNGSLLTPEEFAIMEAAEWEITNVYSGQRADLDKRHTNASDEEIVRAFLQSRTNFWQQLPYDWLDMDDESLFSWNILECPDFVREAYKRSRADSAQRSKFAKDYSRGDAVVTEWLDKLEK
jgi:hypothetical protein